MGASALLGALAVWQWAWSDSYVDFMLGDDPGPLIDPTVFVTPGESIVLAGLGGNACCGASRFTGASLRRCHGPTGPLVPAAAAIGAETFTFFHEPPSPTADKIIAFGTASAVLGFWISTAWHAARIPEGTESAKAAPSATAPVIVRSPSGSAPAPRAWGSPSAGTSDGHVASSRAELSLLAVVPAPYPPLRRVGPPSSALDYAAVVSEYFLGLRGAGSCSRRSTRRSSPGGSGVASRWPSCAAGCAAASSSSWSAGPRGRRGRCARSAPLAVEDEWRAYQSRVGDAPPPAGGAPSPRRGSATRARSSRRRAARRRPRCARATAPRGARSRPPRPAPATRRSRASMPPSRTPTRASSPPGSLARAPVPRGARPATAPARRPASARHEPPCLSGRAQGAPRRRRAGGGVTRLRGSV